MGKIVNKLLLISLVYAGIWIIFKGAFLLFQDSLDYFLDHVFPDAATDDLNLVYVLSNLSLLYWYFYFISIGFLSVALVLRSTAFFSMTLLLINIDFFLLMRSNWEFGVWIGGIFEGYGGGLLTGAIVLLNIGIIITWLLLELVFMLLSHTPKQNERFISIMKNLRYTGLIYSLAISVLHFIPTIYLGINTFP